MPVLALNSGFLIVKCVTQSFMGIDRHLKFNWSYLAIRRAIWIAYVTEQTVSTHASVIYLQDKC